MMDEVARHNKERWRDLARAGVSFSRPWLDLDAATAKERLDREGVLGDVAGLRVLCLASGGGQQSVAFGLLGASVTVLDFCEEQLERDREATAHHGLEAEILDGDMRDLSAFPDDSVDFVWNAHALNFVPDPRPVFDEVARVLAPGGRYRLSWTNPFVHGIWKEPWVGEGYRLRRKYVDGADITYEDARWTVKHPDGSGRRVRGPREWRHALSTVLNGLVARGFVLEGVWESLAEEDDPQPDTWQHIKSIAPPWLTLWATYNPSDVV